MLDPSKNDTLHPRAKEKPQQVGRRSEITFRIKPHIHQKHSEGSNKTLCTPGDPTETETDLPLSVSCRGTGQQWAGLWVFQTWVCHKPSWGWSPLTQPMILQNLHRTEETDSWRTQTKPCAHQDPGERRSDPTRH